MLCFLLCCVSCFALFLGLCLHDSMLLLVCTCASVCIYKCAPMSMCQSMSVSKCVCVGMCVCLCIAVVGSMARGGQLVQADVRTVLTFPFVSLVAAAPSPTATRAPFLFSCCTMREGRGSMQRDRGIDWRQSTTRGGCSESRLSHSKRIHCIEKVDSVDESVSSGDVSMTNPTTRLYLLQWSTFLWVLIYVTCRCVVVV